MSFETDLEAAANEELERALTLGWRQLADLTPWGDTYEGFTPGAARSVSSAATCGKPSRAAIFVSKSPFMSHAPTKRALG